MLSEMFIFTFVLTSLCKQNNVVSTFDNADHSSQMASAPTDTTIVNQIQWKFWGIESNQICFQPNHPALEPTMSLCVRVRTRVTMALQCTSPAGVGQCVVQLTVLLHSGWTDEAWKSLHTTRLTDW